MESGNSSMQSSSGGDEEYDSRSESAPSFLNPSSNGSLPNPYPSLFSHHHNQQPTFFDPSSNYLHALSQSRSHPNSNYPISLLNLDLVGPSSLRSEPNCTDTGNLQSSSSTSHSILAAQGLDRGSFPGSTSMQSRLLHEHNGTRSLALSEQITAAKNPKKRTRASRRAPTTVLTTDTSNFRAMVQEFTGIPAQPFSVSSSTRRLDLFGSGSGMGSGIKAGHVEPMGPLYPLRPTTQKFQPNPFASSSSSVVDAIAAASASTIGASANSNAITTSISTARNTFNSPSLNNFPLLSDLGLNKETHNLLSMNQNPLLSFQSLLQPPHNPSNITLPGFTGKCQASFGMSGYDELAMSAHGQVNASLGGLPNHVDSGQSHMRPFDGNINGNSSERVTRCKLNYSASSSDFHHDKSLENVSSRGEGTVDSWICPSD